MSVVELTASAYTYTITITETQSQPTSETKMNIGSFYLARYRPYFITKCMTQMEMSVTLCSYSLIGFRDE